MPRTEADTLANALEDCAAVLDQRGAYAAGTYASLPRLRPPSALPAASRLAPAGFPPPADVLATDDDALQELAAEFRDAAEEVRRGGAVRGWVNSLVGRASRFLGESELADIQSAARSAF